MSRQVRARAGQTDRTARRLVSALMLAVVLLAGVGGAHVAASDPPPGVRVQPGSLTLAAGGSGVVAVEAIAPAGGLGSWTVDLTYNPALVRPSGCAPGTASACNPAYAPNRVRMSGAAIPGLTGVPVLASITFAAVGAPGASSALTVTTVAFSDSNGTAVTPTLGHGSITIDGSSSATVSVQPQALMLAPGGSGAVAVEATGPAAGLGGWTVELAYDPTVVQPSGCGPGPASTCNPAYAPGRVRITGAVSPALSGTVTLATLTFTAIGAGGRGGPLTLAAPVLTDGGGRPLQPVLAHGAVTVGAAAAAAVRITPATSTIPENGTASLTLETTAPVTGLGSWVVDVAYPAAGLTLTTCVAGSGGVCNPRFGAGVARISGASAAGSAGTSSLAALTFQAVAPVGTTLPVTPQVVALTDAGGAAAPVTATPGALVVSARPVIGTLNPATATAGAGAFTLTVDGSGFQAGAVLRWNGAARTTSVQSATRLTAQISEADLVTAGAFPVTVLNPAPDNTVSNSVTLPVVNPAVPAAPSGLVVTGSTPASVALTWADNATNEASYRVMRNGSLLATRPADTTAYVDGAVSCGTAYAYTVVAANLGGESPPSNPVTVTPVCAPAVPGNLRAGTRTRTAIPLLWDDRSQGETAYQVSWSLAAPVSWNYVDLAANSTAWTHTPVADGKEYVYAVRACTGTTCSDWSPSLAVTSLIPAAPAALRLLMVSGTAIEIGWTNVSMYPTTLQVVWTPTGPQSYTVVDLPAGALAWTHTGLSSGQSYFYWVRACAGGQCSDLTSALTGTVASALPPTGLQVASVTSSSVTLAWNTGAYRATSFEVIWTPAETQSYTTVPVANTAFTWTHSGLEPGRSYFYWVQSCNAIGCSSLAGSVSAVTAGGTAPALPARFRVGATSDGVIVLLWDDVATTETSYQLIWATSGVPTYRTVTLAANSSVHIQTGVPVGENRHFWLRACISLLCSNLAGAVTTSAYAAPSAPVNLRAGTVAGSTIQIMWDDVATNETAYEVVWNPAGSTAFVTVPLGAGVSQWTLSGAGAGQRYAFWVRACRGYVCSEYTSSISITAGLSGSASSVISEPGPAPGVGFLRDRRGASIAPPHLPTPIEPPAPPGRRIASGPAAAAALSPPTPVRLPLPRVAPHAPQQARILPRPPADAPLPAPPQCGADLRRCAPPVEQRSAGA